MNPLWLPLTIAGYVALGVSGIIDKFIVGKALRHSAVVSFYVAALGIFSVWMLGLGFLPLPFADVFRFELPNGFLIGVALVAGVLLQLALWSMYAALQKDEATRVVSTIGAINPIATLILAFVFLDENLRGNYVLAFAFLLSGAVLISVHRKQVLGRSFGLASLSAVLFAAHTVVAKYVYDHHQFISSFIIITFGGGLYALVLAMLHPEVRAELSSRFKKKAPAKPGRQNPLLLIAINSGASGVGVMAVNIALKLGSASLVNALRGVQYAAVFLIAVFLSRRFPRLLKEELTKHTIEQKILAVGLISLGIIILTLNQP